MLHRVALFAAVIAFGSQVTGREAIAIRVAPSMGLAPCDVVVQAFIEPNEHNRSVAVEIESTNFFTSSEAGLDGDRAPRSKEVRFRNLPAGVYQVRVTLITDQ